MKIKKDQEKKTLDELNAKLRKMQQESVALKNEAKKGLNETLKSQMMERTAQRLQEQERKKAPYLTSLPTRSGQPSLADCDKCQRTYPKNRLTRKRALKL